MMPRGLYSVSDEDAWRIHAAAVRVQCSAAVADRSLSPGLAVDGAAPSAEVLRVPPLVVADGRTLRMAGTKPASTVSMARLPLASTRFAPVPCGPCVWAEWSDPMLLVGDVPRLRRRSWLVRPSGGVVPRSSADGVARTEVTGLRPTIDEAASGTELARLPALPRLCTDPRLVLCASVALPVRRDDAVELRRIESLVGGDTRVVVC
jgi:hypothetical protein